MKNEKLILNKMLLTYSHGNYYSDVNQMELMKIGYEIVAVSTNQLQITDL